MPQVCEEIENKNSGKRRAMGDESGEKRVLKRLYDAVVCNRRLLI